MNHSTERRMATKPAIDRGMNPSRIVPESRLISIAAPAAAADCTPTTGTTPTSTPGNRPSAATKSSVSAVDASSAPRIARTPRKSRASTSATPKVAAGSDPGPVDPSVRPTANAAVPVASRLVVPCERKRVIAFAIAIKKNAEPADTRRCRTKASRHSTHSYTASAGKFATVAIRATPNATTIPARIVPLKPRATRANRSSTSRADPR